MDMIRHNHEPHTARPVLRQFVIQHAQQYSFRMIVIEESASSEYRKRYKMRIQTIVDNSPS
jgi:hypothetical protein